MDPTRRTRTDQQHQLAGVRVLYAATDARPETGAGDLAADESGHLAFQAAARRQVSRWHAVYRRRRRVQLRARPRRLVAVEHLCDGVGRSQEDRRPDSGVQPGGANPSSCEHIGTINIMSSAWCEKNSATKPQNYTQKKTYRRAQRQRHRALHAQVARARYQDGSVKNPGWWGIKEGLFEGNADEVDLSPDRVRCHPRRRPHLRRGGHHPRPAAAGHAAPEADGRREDRRGDREPDRVHRHGSGRATSSSTATSRARTRSRTSACARRSIRRSTSTRSRPS